MYVGQITHNCQLPLAAVRGFVAVPWSKSAWRKFAFWKNRTKHRRKIPEISEFWLDTGFVVPYTWSLSLSLGTFKHDTANEAAFEKTSLHVGKFYALDIACTVNIAGSNGPTGKVWFQTGSSGALADLRSGSKSNIITTNFWKRSAIPMPKNDWIDRVWCHYQKST